MGLGSLVPALYTDADPAYLVWVRAVLEATAQRRAEQEARANG